MMCAHLLKRHKGKQAEKISVIGGYLHRIQNGYGATLNWVLSHKRSVLAILFATIGLNIYLYIAIPKHFSLNKIQAVYLALFVPTKAFHSKQ